MHNEINKKSKCYNRTDKINILKNKQKKNLLISLT